MNLYISKSRSLSEINNQNLIARLQDQNQELEDKNKRIAELEGQLKRERKVNSDEFVDKKELKKKNKKSKQKAK
jgi:hypothetical protein